jgi:hypothetical protein
MRTATLAASSLALALLSPGQACALRGEEYDLASLILDSHAVVLAVRGEQRPLANWAGATAYEVKKAYRGTMAPGQKFEVFGDMSDYRATGSKVETFNGPVTVEADSILILDSWHPSSLGWLPRDAPSLRVRSFERFLAGGRVLIRGEAIAVTDRGSFPSVKDLGTLEEFEAVLREAILRIERFSLAIRIEDPLARRQAILATIVPRSHPLETGHAPLGREGGADRLRQRALELFADWGDLDAFLEVAARSGEGLGFHFRSPLGGVQLLKAASREDLSSRHRAAALYLLAREYSLITKGMFDEVAPLLRCKHLDVKWAAAYVLAQTLRIQAANPGSHPREQSLPIAKALLSAWREEPDTAFRLTIWREVKGTIFSELLEEEDRRPRVLLLWEIRDDLLAVLGESFDGTPLGRRRISLLALSLEGNVKDHRASRMEAADLISSNGAGGEAYQVRFDPPLRPGRHGVWLEIGEDDDSAAPGRVFRTDIEEIHVPENR